MKLLILVLWSCVVLASGGVLQPSSSTTDTLKKIYIDQGTYGRITKGWLGQASELLRNMGYQLIEKRSFVNLKDTHLVISFEVNVNNYKYLNY